ncbi:hypothetical protein WMY93_007090 [Mugilogobius chulae]|uniref:Peptidylprolyl isomerase n=1 Tax=Mugilogobius chulae TaxID=88201 RepID=A0AAW0PLW2_9GOBI
MHSLESSLVGGHLVGRAHGRVSASQRLGKVLYVFGPQSYAKPWGPAGGAEVILILTKLYDFHIGSVTESTLWSITCVSCLNPACVQSAGGGVALNAACYASVLPNYLIYSTASANRRE